MALGFQVVRHGLEAIHSILLGFPGLFSVLRAGLSAFIPYTPHTSILNKREDKLAYRLSNLTEGCMPNASKGLTFCSNIRDAVM